MRPDHLPERILVDREGTALSPRRAITTGTEIYVIFHRDDGWSLGAPAELEDVARAMWPDQWVTFSRGPDWESRPMSEYLSPLESS